jgi:hypothetical protein
MSELQHPPPSKLRVTASRTHKPIATSGQLVRTAI